MSPLSLPKMLRRPLLPYMYVHDTVTCTGVVYCTAVDIPVAFSAIVAFSAVLIFLVRLCIDPELILVLHDVLFLEKKNSSLVQIESSLVTYPCQVIGLHSLALKQKIEFG